MNITDLIAECGRAGVTLTPALDYDGPEDALASGLEACLRERKFDVVRQLVGPAGVEARGGLSLSDWRFEWLKEHGMLSLRWRDAADSEVKTLLRELMAETPRTQNEWLHLGDMICRTEGDLRRRRKLPPIPNFGP